MERAADTTELAIEDTAEDDDSCELGDSSETSRNDKHSANNPECTQTITNGQHFLDMLDIKSLGTWRKSKFVDHKKKAKSLKSLRRLDIFNSSPSLVIQDRSDNSASSSWWTSRKWSDTTPRKSSMQTDLPSQVLQFTTYECHGSLITLNLTDQLGQPRSIQNEYVSEPSHDALMNKLKEDMIKETEEDSEKQIKLQSNGTICQSINQESDLDDQNDTFEEDLKTNNLELSDISTINHGNDTLRTVISTTDSFDEVTDSDSGIYSLYDSVVICKNLELTSDLDEKNSPIQEFDKKFLNDAFHESKLLKELMSSLEENSYETYTQEIVQKFSSKSVVPSLLAATVNIVQNIRERQDVLKKYLTKLELEKVENAESISCLKLRIFKETTNNLFLTKFQELIDQIDQITNLIFGIEMKIEKCSYNQSNVINCEYWNSRLSEAILIKNKHNESLTGLIKSNVSEENQLELQEKISQKQRLICQLKLIRAEIYCNEMQLKIFFM